MVRVLVYLKLILGRVGTKQEYIMDGRAVRDRAAHTAPFTLSHT